MEAIADLVTVARDQVEFLRGITTALAGGESPDLRAHRQAFAASQTWTQRAYALRHAVETPSLIGVQVTAPPAPKAAQI
jgi:hypothetical protein